MKLWLIKRTDIGTGYSHYDETYEVLVRAEDEDTARAVATDTMPEWDGFKRAPFTVTEVTTEGEPEVIIVDFLNG